MSYVLRLIAVGVLLLGADSASSYGASLSRHAEPGRDWVVVYYMSYDNDLNDCGPIILEGLEQGVRDSRLVVTVLSDDTDRQGLTRYVVTAEGRRRQVLKSDNSASEQVLGEYLTWVAETYPAKHYAVVFLNHGGGLDDMCLDEWPGKDQQRDWLSARLVGPALRCFRKQVPGDVELLFLQQCGRATVENLYNFCGAAAFVMASSVPVGAPNTYYEKTLQWLARTPDATGSALARQIMVTDEDFTHYVCVDGPSLAELPVRLGSVFAVLLADARRPPKPPVGLRPCFRYDQETNYDLVAWLQAAFRVNNRSAPPVDAFVRWMGDRLIVARATRGGPSRAKLCGLSLLVPEGEEVRGAYADYPFYRRSCVAELWKSMYPPTPAPGKQ